MLLILFISLCPSNGFFLCFYFYVCVYLLKNIASAVLQIRWNPSNKQHPKRYISSRLVFLIARHSGIVSLSECTIKIMTNEQNRKKVFRSASIHQTKLRTHMYIFIKLISKLEACNMFIFVAFLKVVYFYLIYSFLRPFFFFFFFFLLSILFVWNPTWTTALCAYLSLRMTVLVWLRIWKTKQISQKQVKKKTIFAFVYSRTHTYTNHILVLTGLEKRSICWWPIYCSCSLTFFSWQFLISVLSCQLCPFHPKILSRRQRTTTSRSTPAQSLQSPVTISRPARLLFHRGSGPAIGECCPHRPTRK